MNTHSARGLRTERPQSANEVFRMPCVLGAVSAVGLLSALLGDGPWDALSWVALFAPCAAVIWASRRRADRPVTGG